MAVNLKAPAAGDLHPVPGVRIGVAEANVRKPNRKDLTVFLLDEGAAVAGVFTRNRFCAAPVQVCQQHLARGGIRALVINTGCANAGRVAVTSTAAVLVTRMADGETATPIRCSRLVRLCAENIV